MKNKNTNYKFFVTGNKKKGHTASNQIDTGNIKIRTSPANVTKVMKRDKGH